MSDPLGRGLASLIPDREPDEIPPALPRPQAVPADAVSPTVLVAPLLEEPMPDMTLPSSPVPEPPVVPPMPAAKHSYEDHFVPRRDDSVFWIEIDKIDPNPYQPRREFVESALKDLANSIREHGILQPILVTKREIETPGGLAVRYQLIAGERRWRAARMAGLSQIPAMIRRGVPDDRIRLELALIENVQREDLNPIEKAKAFKQLIDEFKLMQREISTRVGKSREAITNTLRLLTLPAEIQDGLSQGRISEGQARAILMAGDDAVLQRQLYAEMTEHRMTVREAENRARQISGKTLIPRTRASRVGDPQFRMWESRLEEALGTKVKLEKLGERGKIVVEFYSEEELKGILRKLVHEL